MFLKLFLWRFILREFIFVDTVFANFIHNKKIFKAISGNLFLLSTISHKSYQSFH